MPVTESERSAIEAEVEARIRSQIGRIGAHASWAKTEDRSARTAPARRAMLDKFEREVDPNNELTPAERAERAESARKGRSIATTP
jgi:hypothetical protein